MWHQQQRARHAQAGIGSVERHTATGVEKALAIEIDEGAAQDGIIALPEDRNRRTFLHPHEIGHLDAELLKSGVDAFCLLGAEARGLQDHDARRHMAMMSLVGGNRLHNQVLGILCGQIRMASSRFCLGARPTQNEAAAAFVEHLRRARPQLLTVEVAVNPIPRKLVRYSA